MDQGEFGGLGLGQRTKDYGGSNLQRLQQCGILAHGLARGGSSENTILVTACKILRVGVPGHAGARGAFADLDFPTYRSIQGALMF